MPGAADAAAAIDALIARIDSAVRAGVNDGIGLIESDAKTLAHVKTGTLRRSILPAPTVRSGPYAWTGRVGPTVVYGRQKELGGHIYPVRARALRFIAADGTLVFTQHVYQHPQPYLKPATDGNRSRYRSALQRRIAAAILA